MKRKDILTRMEELLDKFGISEYKDKKIKELSKGNQQKVQFITAILNNPKLLILDEPFSGLDPFNVELFKNEIIEMSKKGSIIIFSSHRMEHVELFCKKLVIILKGKTVLSGELKEIKEKYQKKDIFIKGDIKKEELEKLNGVCEVIEYSDELEVIIENKDVVGDIFNYVKTKKNITKFVVEEPSLNEIFVSKVGESFEK
jgi:ABC-2 type transport system ATP-binding protein